MSGGAIFLCDKPADFGTYELASLAQHTVCEFEIPYASFCDFTLGSASERAVTPNLLNLLGNAWHYVLNSIVLLAKY